MHLQESKFFSFISDGLEYSELLTRWNGLHIHRETDLSTCLRFSAENTKFSGSSAAKLNEANAGGSLFAENPRGLVSFHRKFVL